MAQPKEYLTFLTDSDGKSYRVHNGNVEAVNTPTPLDISPDGLRDTVISYKRSSDYYGLFRSFTTPLKFVRNAAKIVRARLYNYGPEDKIYMLIHRLAKSFGGGWIHKLFYRGELDLSQTTDIEQSAEVNVMEGDLQKLFKANENTVYELDLNVPEVVIVKADGLNLTQTAQYFIGNGNVFEESDYYGNHAPDLSIVASEGVQLNIKAVERTKLGGADGGQQNIKLVQQEAWFFKSTTSADLTISWDFYMTCELAPSIPVNPAVLVFFAIRILNDDGSLVTGFLLNQFDGPDNVYRKNHFTGQMTLTGLLPGQKLYPVVGINIIGESGDQAVRFTYDDDGGEFKILKSVYRHPTTFIKALRPAYVGQQLLDKITGGGGGYTFTSSLLSSTWEQLVITSGDGLRGFEDAKVRTSLKDFLTSYNVTCNLSMRIKDAEMIVEDKASAYDRTVMVDLGAVKNLKSSPITDDFYSTIKIGYPDSNTEDINGRDEFNVTQVYTTPIKRVNKELNLVSKYRASMYEQELIRINLDGKTTTDDQNDKEVYFMHIEKNPTAGAITEPVSYYKLLRNAYDSITGLISPETAYNVELSPKRCLRRHGNYLRSLLYWQQMDKLIFQSSDKNAELKCVSGTTVIEEKADITIGSLPTSLFVPLGGDPNRILFIPQSFEFESEIPEDMITLMEETPARMVQFSYDGNTYYGFIDEINIKPVGKPAQTTKLICSPDSDLTKLIH